MPPHLLGGIGSIGATVVLRLNYGCIGMSLTARKPDSSVPKAKPNLNLISSFSSDFLRTADSRNGSLGPAVLRSSEAQDFSR